MNKQSITCYVQYITYSLSPLKLAGWDMCVDRKEIKVAKAERSCLEGI